MKLDWHPVILGALVFVCASTSLGQTPDSVGRGAGLTLSANVVPASIIELSSKSNYIKDLETPSNTMCTLRVVLADSGTADLVKQTAAGTLIMTKVEFLVRFSGFRNETAEIVITIASVEDESGRLSLVEGTSEASWRKLQPGQVIKLDGVRSGERVVRYVGFLLDESVGEGLQKNNLGATLTYEVRH